MHNNSNLALDKLNAQITKCVRCTRLVDHRELVATAKRKSFINDIYWGKPVSGFGDRSASLIIIGLAPAAHGANRTGRVFTGDQSAKFLMEGLGQAGFANQTTSEYSDDGLLLLDTYITCAVKCVPPENKPTRQEQLQCLDYLGRELALLDNIKVVLTLGKFAFSSYYRASSGNDDGAKEPKFIHGGRYAPEDGSPVVYASYHPSPRNTNTGLLTSESFAAILQRIRGDLETGESANR